jgi:tetratricopeptide (TPR) repeat protein
MANYYYEQKDHDTALDYALKALDERREYPLEKAATLDLLGCIQLAKHNTEAADDYLQQALKIRLKYWKHINPNHPDIGISYQNLGKLDSKSSLYIDAQNNYQRAEQIFRYNYPESHSLMVDITKRLKDIGRRLGN